MADIRIGASLDEFQYADQNPLQGDPDFDPFPSWGQMSTHPNNGQLRLLSNAAHTNTTMGLGIDYSAWYETFPAGDIEVWGCPSGGEAGAALTGWRIGFMMADSVPGLFSGYLFLRATALGDFIYFRKYTNAVFTDLDNASGPFTGSYKPLLMARKVGSSLQAWVCSTSNGLGTWTLICTANDSTYNGPWKLILGVEDDTNAGVDWICFGGGVEEEIPQIYRRPSE